MLRAMASGAQALDVRPKLKQGGLVGPSHKSEGWKTNSTLVSHANGTRTIHAHVSRSREQLRPVASGCLPQSLPWARARGTGFIGGLGQRTASVLMAPGSGPFYGKKASTVALASSGAAAPGGDSWTPSSMESMAIDFCTTCTKLFPLWVVLAAFFGYYFPPVFSWFDTTCISNGLIFIMLGMGITLTLDEIFTVFQKQPQLLLLGMGLQYTVLPCIGWAISRYWGLEPGLAIGVALVSCMPGGTASNIIAYIAKGDMPLSIMMTTASTLAAIVTTPLLTSLLVGTLVPVDPKAMFLSVLQLVLVPVLVGATINTYCPKQVSRIKPYMPFTATLMCIFIIGSMVSTNVAVLATAGGSIIGAVLLLHSSGFFLGYSLSKVFKLPNKVARTNSIEVGMQSSAFAGVLAKLHFSDPVVVAPCVVSVVVMTMLGSVLAGIWNATVVDPDA